MAKRGRPRKSNEDKMLEGNPGNRPIEEEDEIEFHNAGPLDVPQRLCKEGRQAFKELMDAFPDWYFDKKDRHLLIAYCEVVARMTKANRKLRQSQMIVTRGNGAQCINPLLTVIQQAELRLQALSDALGISREKRQGIATVDPERVVPAAGTAPAGEEVSEFGDLIQMPTRGRTA